jgi:hypothetical protein
MTQSNEQIATIEPLIEELRATRADTVRRYESVDPGRLEDVREWHGGHVDLRHLLASLTERGESRRIQMLGIGRRLERGRMSDAQHAMGIAGGVRGRLLGALIGIDEGLFDRPPGQDEWSIRQVLGHVIAVDERYRLAVEFAIERARRGGDGPERPAESGLPDRVGASMSHGTPAEVLARMQSVRDQVIASLIAIPDELLAAPTSWTSFKLDVRFRLHRFAAHDREHAIQIRKALQALGFAPAEPQMLLADAQEELGTLEVTLRSIGGEFLPRRHSPNEPSILELVQELIAEERSI